MRRILFIALIASLAGTATLRAQPLPSTPHETAVTVDHKAHPITLPEILASLDKSRVLLENDDRAGCRAILRELKVKLADDDRPIIKRIRRQVQYIQLKLWMHMRNLARSHLVDLIDVVRSEIRDRNP